MSKTKRPLGKEPDVSDLEANPHASEIRRADARMRDLVGRIHAGRERGGTPTDQMLRLAASIEGEQHRFNQAQAAAEAQGGAVPAADPTTVQPLDPAFTEAMDWGRQARLNAPVYEGQRETYQQAYRELYDKLTGEAYADRGEQLQALMDSFTPRREVTYIDPQKERARQAGMNIDPRVTARNYDPDNPDARIKLFVPEGAKVLDEKVYEGEDNYSPRVKAEMLRQEENRKRYWGNRMRESVAVSRGEETFPSQAPVAIQPEGARRKRTEIENLLGVDLGAAGEALDIAMGLTANPVDVTRYGLARLSNMLGLTDTPEEEFDASWHMLRGRAERGVKAFTNPETPGEMAFSVGVDALATYLTVGASKAVTGLSTTRTLATAAKGFAGGLATNFGTTSMIDAVKKVYYDPVARGKRTFEPQEARQYLQDTYGVYAGALSDDEASRLARAMNNQMADATFNLNPFGMADRDPIIQGIMYGLDAGAGMLGGAGQFDPLQEREAITTLAPKLFDLKPANPLEGGDFAKDVHDLLELIAQGEAKRKSIPEAAKWAEQITAALPYMYRMIAEQKMLGAAGEINLKLGLKRLVRDATELMRNPEKSAALARLGKALFTDGPETLGKIMLRSYAGALTEGIVPVARDGQYLYGKMLEDGASPGEAFFGSYFTSLTSRAFERISESGLVPIGQFGNALSKSFFRRFGTNIFRRAFGEYSEEAATDVATYLTEEATGVPRDYRQQPFRPILLGGGVSEAIAGDWQNEAVQQAIGEFVVSAGIGAIMGTARMARHPFGSMHSAVQSLQNDGLFMSYVDRGLREKYGWTDTQIASTSAIDRSTEYYAAKYNLTDAKKKQLRQAIELNVVGKGASALAETIARDYEAFMGMHGGTENFAKLQRDMEEDRMTEGLAWFWKPDATRTAAETVINHDAKDPVAGDPHVEEVRRRAEMREMARTMPTPEMNAEGDQTAFTRPRATGPRQMFREPDRMESNQTGVIAEPEATAEDVSGVAAYFAEKAIVRNRKLLKKDEHSTAITKMSRVVEKGIAAGKDPDAIIEDVFATGLRFRDKSASDVLRAFIGMKYKGETIATFEDAVRAARPEGARPEGAQIPPTPTETRSLAEQNREIRARIAERDELARELEAFDERLAAERATRDGSTPAVQPETNERAPGEATGVDALPAEGTQMEMFDAEPMPSAREVTESQQRTNTDEKGRRWYTGPRGGVYYLAPDGRKVRGRAVPVGVTPRDSRLPEEEPVVIPTAAAPPVQIRPRTETPVESPAAPASTEEIPPPTEEPSEMFDLTDDEGRVVVTDPTIPRDEYGRIIAPPSLESEFDLQKGVPTRHVGKGRRKTRSRTEAKRERARARQAEVEQAIRNNPELATRLMRRFKAAFPWIRVENIEGLKDKDGTPIYGMSSRLAFWIGLDVARGRLDTIPHEYAHQFVRMFRGHDLIESGISQYGTEEDLVDRIGREAVTRADDGFLVSWMKDFTQLVREVFGRAEHDYAREISRQLYKGNRTMTQQTLAERLMHGRASVTPTNRDILEREMHLGRLGDAAVDYQTEARAAQAGVTAAEYIGAAEQREADEGRPGREKASGERRGAEAVTYFEGSVEEHSSPARGLVTTIAAQTGHTMATPLTDVDLLNILELPTARAAIDAIMQAAETSERRVREAVHRWVARNWTRRDFPKLNVWIDREAEGAPGIRIDINQSRIERGEDGRVTAVDFGTYTNDKGNRLITWEIEPLLVKMAKVGEFFEAMGLRLRPGVTSPVSRINTVGTTSQEAFDYTELGTLAGSDPRTYNRMVAELVRNGFILIGPPGKNDSFITLNVDMSGNAPITPAVYERFAQAITLYEQHLDKNKRGWRDTPSGKEHMQMRARLEQAYVEEGSGRMVPDITLVNQALTRTEQMLAIQTAFLTWSMGPEWAKSGIKVFKYMNTLAAAEQQSIAEFADEAVREAAGEAMAEYWATLPADMRAIHERAQRGLSEVVAPNISEEEIRSGKMKDDWNIAARLATQGFTLTKSGVAFKMQNGQYVPGSVRMVMAIVDHDTYIDGVPLGDGSSLISPGASVVQDRAHGDPNGDVKFHKVRMFIPWRGRKDPLLWKGQFDVAAGMVLDVMERNGIGLVVFDSTVKVGRDSRARKHRKNDKPVFQNVSDMVREGIHGSMAGTDWYLVDPAVISKANDATSKAGHTTSLVTQLLYANAISPIVNPAWEKVYTTMRKTLARLSAGARDFLYEVHGSPTLLRAVYEKGEEDEYASEPEQILRAMLRKDKGRTPGLVALPHWRAATNSASVRTVLDQLFDDQGSMRVIGQGAFLRADNGVLDGVNLAAIIEAGGIEAAMKYCDITEIVPYGDRGVDPEMHEEIMRKMWQEDNADRHKGTKVTKLLEDQLQEWRSYSDEAFQAMIISRGWGVVEAGGRKYMVKGDGRLKARVDGAVPVVLAYNKAKKMGLTVGDKMMAVAYPTDAPHNAQACVIVGVSKGVNDWMSYSSKVVQKLGKDHDGDKLSLYGPSEGYWRGEVKRLEGELKAAYLKGHDEERMEDLQRDIDLARARARHGFQELSRESFDALWKHYASDAVQNYVTDLYGKIGIKTPFDGSAIGFIKNTVWTFKQPWEKAIKAENRRREKEGRPPLTDAEIEAEDKYRNPYPYSILTPKGSAMLMKDYVGQTGDLIAYVAGTRNKIEYVIQNFEAILRHSGVPEEEIAQRVRMLTIPSKGKLSPLDKIAVVGSLLTHHAVDAPKEEAIFEYGFDPGAYFTWAYKELGLTKEQIAPFAGSEPGTTSQYKLLRSAMKARPWSMNVHAGDQHDGATKKAIPESRLAALHVAWARRQSLGAGSLMDMLPYGFSELGSLSIDPATYQDQILPAVVDQIAQSVGFMSTFGPQAKDGGFHLFTSQSRVRQLTDQEKASALGAIRQGVRERDGTARQVAFALLQAQAYDEFNTSGRPKEKGNHTQDSAVARYIEMLEINPKRNPIMEIFPMFAENLAGHLHRMKTPMIETERYEIHRSEGIVDRQTGQAITPDVIRQMLAHPDLQTQKRNANEIWSMIKEVSAGFWKETGSDVMVLDDYTGDDRIEHVGFSLPILTGAQSQRMIREAMDRVLRDAAGRPIGGRYEDAARVLLMNQRPYKILFRLIGRQHQGLSVDRIDLDTHAPASIEYNFTTRRYANTVNPTSFTAQTHDAISAENHLNLAGFGYLTPGMQDTFAEAIRTSPDVARAMDRLAPAREDDISVDTLAIDAEDAIRRKAQRLMQTMRYLYPKVKELSGLVRPDTLASALFHEAATETYELFTKTVADYNALHEAAPNVAPKRVPVLITDALGELGSQLDLFTPESLALLRTEEFDFQKAPEAAAEKVREYQGALRKIGRVVGLIAEWIRTAQMNGLFSTLAPYTVSGKIGTAQPTHLRRGTERIGPTLLFRLATPDRQRSPKIHSNLVADLSMYTAHGLMRDEIAGEEFGDVDLAHAMIRATAEKITSDESAVKAAIDRILAPLSVLQQEYPDQWVRMNQIMLEELHTGSRFGVKLVLSEKAWSWQFPDGSTTSTELDQMSVGDMRALVEKHFPRVAAELAGGETSTEARTAALTQATHLLKMTMQMRRFIAQNNYGLFQESIRIKRHRLARTPNLSVQERQVLEKQIESDTGLLWRIANGEFYFPLFYRPEYFDGPVSKKTRRGSEDAFVDLYLNTASAQKAERITPGDTEAVRRVQTRAALAFIQKAVSPEMFEALRERADAMDPADRLSYFREEMASIIRGSDKPFDIRDVKREAHTLSGGLGMNAFDAHTMQRAVDITLLMDPKVQHALNLPRPAVEYLEQSVGSSAQRMMNNHLNALLGNVAKAVQAEYIDPMRGNGLYAGTLKNWDRFMNGVLHQKNFTQRLELPQLIAGEDVLMDIMESRDVYDPESHEMVNAGRRVSVRMTYRGTEVTPNGRQYVFTFSSKGQPATMMIDGMNLTMRVRTYDEKKGAFTTRTQKDWTFTDLRTYVRDQSRWMEALARKNPERWAGLYSHVAPFWKWLWDTMSTLGGVIKLGWNPISALNNVLYQVKTTAWRIGTPEYTSIERLLKSNDPDLEKEIKEILYALPVYNWEFVATKVSEGTGYEESTLKTVMQSVLIYNQAAAAAQDEARRKSLVGLQEESFVQQKTFEKWAAAMKEKGFKVIESIPGVGTTSEMLSMVAHSAEARKAMKSQMLNLSYRMFQVTEQMNRAMATTTAWNKTRGWQDQSYRLFDSRPVVVGDVAVDVKGNNLTFKDLPRSLQQRILRTQGIYARMQDEAVNYDYSNIMRPAWLRQPMAQFAFKFGIFTMASYVHRTREFSRLIRDRGQKRQSRGKDVGLMTHLATRKTVALDRTIAFDPSMVTEAEWMDVMRMIAPTALNTPEAVAKVKAEVMQYLRELGITLEASQLDPVWNAQKFLAVNIIDKTVKSWVTLGLMSEPLSVFFWSFLDLLGNLTGWGDDDEELQGDPLYKALKNAELRRLTSDLSRNSPVPGGLVFSNLLSGILKWAVLSKFTDGGRYIREYFKDDLNFLRDPSIQMLTNLVASYIPVLRTGADIWAVTPLGTSKPEFGDPTSAGELLGRWVDIGKKDYVGQKIESEAANVREMVHKAARTGKGYNPFVRTARANIMEMRNAVGRSDQQMFRSNAAGHGTTAVGDFQVSLENDDAEMLWLERNRLGEAKAQVGLVKFYTGRMNRAVERERMLTPEDMQRHEKQAEDLAARRIQEWNARMRDIGIPGDLRGEKETERMIDRAGQQ